MLLVETFVKKSPIHGLGLYSAKFIPKGQKMWQMNEKLDLIITGGILRDFQK